MTPWLALLILALVAAPAPAASAAAADAAAIAPEAMCEHLFVPPDYDLACSLLRGTGEHGWEVVVQPQTGSFAWLSELAITPIAEPVGKPETWLSERVALDLSSVDRALETLTKDPDSPIAGTEFAWPLEGVRRFMQELAGLPLEACEEPQRITRHDAWEMACLWQVGSIERFMTYRLVERGAARYLVRIDAMNPQRYRHLVAIANSF